MEEAMLFRLQSVQRVLAIGDSGRVYLARYIVNHCASLHRHGEDNMEAEPVVVPACCQLGMPSCTQSDAA